MKSTELKGIPLYLSRNLYTLGLKTLLDYFILLVTIPFWLPLLITLLLLTWLFTLENPIYLQKRAGKNHVPIWVIKIKTIYRSQNRLCKYWSAFLRSTGLDELPQVWNILKGEMSWIGPRPLFYHYLNSYTNLQKKRHLVKPGLTGLAQVEGRNTLSWDHKFFLDLYYVSHLNFWLDLLIAIKTLHVLYTSFTNPVLWQQAESYSESNKGISFFNYDKTI